MHGITHSRHFEMSTMFEWTSNFSEQTRTNSQNQSVNHYILNPIGEFNKGRTKEIKKSYKSSLHTLRVEIVQLTLTNTTQTSK